MNARIGDPARAVAARGATGVMISPEDRLAYLAELAQRTGRHRVEGERMVLSKGWDQGIPFGRPQ